MKVFSDQLVADVKPKKELIWLAVTTALNTAAIVILAILFFYN